MLRATVFVAFDNTEIIVKLFEYYRQLLDVFPFDPDNRLVVMGE
jgi:hypothetical protein